MCELLYYYYCYCYTTVAVIIIFEHRKRVFIVKNQTSCALVQKQNVLFIFMDAAAGLKEMIVH